MSGLGDMKLRIGADATDLSRGLRVGEDGIMRFNKSVGTLQDQLKRFQTALQTSTNPASIERLNRAIEATKGRIDAIKNVGSGSFDKLNQSVGNALPTLTNFGRVVQDAPFGIIGIANNIDPLVSSFQQLQAQTGSAGGAFKALGASLLGPAGIAIGVSVVTSALISFGPQIANFITGAREASKETLEFRKSVDSITQSVAKEGAEVGTFVAVLKSENETRERKIAALKELNRIAPETFGNLKLEKGEVIGLDTAYKNYIQNLRNVIAVRVKQLQLEQLIQKQLKEEGKTLVGVEKALGLDAISQGLEDQAKAAEAGGSAIGAAVTRGLAKTQQTQRTQRVNALQSQINDIIKDISALSKGIELTIPAPKIEKINKSSIVKDIEEAIIGEKDLGATFFGNKIIENQARAGLKEISEKLRSDFDAKTIQPIPLPVTFQPKVIDQFDAAFAESLTMLGTDAFSMLTQGIADAFAGNAEGLKSAFKGILNLVGDFLIQLGKAAIQQGLILKALSTIKAPNLKIAAGIASVALGSILKSFTPRFATGVQNFTGGTAIVGERGPEVVQLPRGSNVIPNDRLGQLGGNQMLNLNVDWVLRGDQLVALVNRTQANNRRNFG
jgi:hypothetical protein